MINYAWISKRDATFAWRPSWLKSDLFSGLISGNLAIWTVLVLEKSIIWCFWVPREINSRFSSKTVGAYPDGHQHGVSKQISINLGKTFLRISYIRRITVTWNLARVFAYAPSFDRFSESGLYLLNDFDFYFGLFWMAWHWKPTISKPRW